MGIIAKQSILGTIYLYLGFGIGFVTSSLLFPRFLSTEQIGLLSLLVSISLVFGQLGTLGFNVISFRFFPYFQNKSNGHNGFPRLLILFSALGVILSISALYLLKNVLISFNLHNQLFIDNFSLLIPFIIASLLFFNFEAFTNINLNVTTSVFLRELLQRFFILVAIAFVFFNLMDFNGFKYVYVAAYSLPTLILIFLLWKNGNLSFRRNPEFVTPKLKKDMARTGFWGMMLSLSNTANINIDKFLLGGFVNLAANGVYATVSYFGIVVSMPSRVMRKIAGAMLSHAWKENDWETVCRIYKKTTTVQYCVGSFLFLSVWLNADNILRILPPEYGEGKWVLFWACVLNLVEMLFGVVGQLLYVSPRVNVQTYMTFFLIGVIITLNFLLIPIWGLTGCAVAMVIAFTIFHVMRIVYVIKVYKVHPFEKGIIPITAITLFAWLLINFIPLFSNFVLDVVLRMTLLTLFYFPLCYYFKVSSDINALVDKYLNKYGLQKFVKK